MIMANLENNFYDVVRKTLLLMVDVCVGGNIYIHLRSFRISNISVSPAITNIFHERNTWV